tara:strand:+ start:628 stop:837 length:210 start_codon:yes stop_codon:yes gene_type:complete
MKSYLKSTAITTLIGFSGSLLYYCYNKSSNKKITSESIGEFVNPGLVTGLLIGCVYSYTGKPVLNNLIR